MFTEIYFADTLLKEDLVMIIKVYKLLDIPAKETKTKQKINPKTSEPIKLSFLKSYSIQNLSDRFFEEKMKDGKPLGPLAITFFSYD